MSCLKSANQKLFNFGVLAFETFQDVFWKFKLHHEELFQIQNLYTRKLVLLKQVKEMLSKHGIDMQMDPDLLKSQDGLTQQSPDPPSQLQTQAQPFIQSSDNVF